MKSKNKKIYVVIGTRAQIIKMAPVMARMQKAGIDYEFIYTAQHRETIDGVLKDFGVKSPDRELSSLNEANTMMRFFGWSGMMFSYVFRPKRVFPQRGLILTHGDTATCAWAAFVGKLAGCTVSHVESGLRSYNIFSPFPEELMRLVTFQFSDVYFCPNKWALKNVSRYKGEKVNLGMNPLYDSVIAALKSPVTLERFKQPYVVVSIHRYENIFKNRFEKTIIPLLEMVADGGFTLVFVLHPTTREVLKKNGGVLYRRLERNDHILLRERYTLFHWIKLVNRAAFVITDGGSNQEELSYLGKPTLLFRDVTERIEGLGENVIISKFDRDIVRDFIMNYKNYKRPRVRSTKMPSDVIVAYLKNYLRD